MKDSKKEIIIKKTLAYKLFVISTFMLAISIVLLIGLSILSKQSYRNEPTEAELEQVYQSYMNNNGQGELASLIFQDKSGFSVLLNKKEDGSISIKMHDSSGNVIKNLFTLVKYFIERLKKDKMPINSTLYNMNIDLINGNLDLNINGTFGNAVMQGLLKFLNESAKYCNFTLVNDIVNKLKDNKIHEINLSSNPCGIENAAELLSIISLAGLEYNKTQIKDFENITLIKNQNLVDIFNLKDYFNCQNNLSFIINTLSGKITIIKGADNWVSINPQKDWIGEEKVNVIAKCGSEQLADNFYVKVVQNLVRSHAPEFLTDECGNISLEPKKTYNLDLDNCFKDIGSSNLIYSYGGKTTEINIVLERNILTLSSELNNSVGYFYVYANDSVYSTTGRVNFKVIKEELNVSSLNQTNNINESTTNIDFDEEKTEKGYFIKDPSPGASIINLLVGESKFFSVKNTDYDSLNWMLDGKIVDKDSNAYVLTGTTKGEYNLSVEVQKGKLTDIKTWRVIVDKNKADIEYEKAQSTTGISKILIYFIIFLVIFIISLIIWMTILKRKAKQKNIENKKNF